MHVKVGNFTPLKASPSPEASKFSTPLSASSGNSEQKRPLQKPPSFDGKSQWEPYIAQFEIVAGMNQWNGEQKGNYLATSLKGSALTLLGNLPSDTRQDYKELVAALDLVRRTSKNCIVPSLKVDRDGVTNHHKS